MVLRNIAEAVWRARDKAEREERQEGQARREGRIVGY